MLSLGNHFCSSSIFFLPFFFSALAVALRILILAFNSMSWDSSQPDLGNNPWRSALMTRGQNHRPQAAGLSLCSFRFYPRGFTKMEARKAAGSMTRVTDDWTQLASCFPFPFTVLAEPCGTVVQPAAPVGSRCAAGGCCCLVVVPCARWPVPTSGLPAGFWSRCEQSTSGGGAHHERYSGSDAMGQLRSCSRVFRAILQLQVHD